MSGKGEAPFRPKSSEVHPTNSQLVPLPVMGFENINGLPPIHYGPFSFKVGIMVHLVVNDLLIYLFRFKEFNPTYQKKVLVDTAFCTPYNLSPPSLMMLKF